MMETQQRPLSAARRAGFSRSVVGALTAGVLAVGSLALSAPAQADAEWAGLVTWGSDAGSTQNYVETSPWSKVFPSSYVGSFLAVSPAGKLEWVGTAPSALAEFPAAVADGVVVDASVSTQTFAAAVTADGSLHRWGTQAGIQIRTGTWTPSELGGKAIGFTPAGRYHLVLLEDGRATVVSNLGIFEVTRDGAPLTGIVEIASAGAVRLEDGTVGAVDTAGVFTVGIASDPADPVIDVSNAYAVTADGDVLVVASGAPVAHMPSLDPVVDGKAVEALAGDGSHAMLRTDKGHVVVWRPGDGVSPVSAFALPTAAAEGPVRQIAQAKNGFAVWVGTPPPIAAVTASSINGTAQVGSVLNGVAATFNEVPTTMRTEWRDATSEEVLASDESTLPLTEAHLGRSIQFVTIAEGSSGVEVESVSSAVGPVTAASVASTTTLTVSAGSYGRPARASVSVMRADDEPASGSVTVKVGSSTVGTVTLAAGRGSIVLPKTLAPGRYTVAMSYAGDSAVGASSDTASYSVGKGATSKPSLSRVKAPTSRQAGKATVSVSTASGLAKATGKVTVVLKKGKSTKKVSARLKAGKVVVKLPKLAKGRWIATVTFGGDSKYKAATSSRKTVRVKR